MKHQIFIGNEVKQLDSMLNDVISYCLMNDDKNVFIFTNSYMSSRVIFNDILERYSPFVSHQSKNDIVFINETRLRVSHPSASAVCGCTIDNMFLFHVKPDQDDKFFQEFWCSCIPRLVIKNDFILKWYTDSVELTEDSVYLNERSMTLCRENTDISF